LTKQYCQYYLVNTDQAVLTNTWSVLLGQKNTSTVTTTGAPTTQTPALTTTPPPAQFSCAHCAGRPSKGDMQQRRAAVLLLAVVLCACQADAVKMCELSEDAANLIQVLL
jgi:hypothetical protein